MASAELNDFQNRAVRQRTDLYRQLREQLLDEVTRYRREGKDTLADIISHSLNE